MRNANLRTCSKTTETAPFRREVCTDSPVCLPAPKPGRALIRSLAMAVVCLMGQVGQATEMTDGVTNEGPPVTTASRIGLSGQVTDDTHRPIAEASVTLVTAASRSGRDYADFNPWRPWTETRTDEQGRFRVAFAKDDQRFLIPGDFMLVVHAQGFQMHLVKLAMTRMQVDVPMELTLNQSQPVAVDILGPRGQPVVGASVYPASIHGVRIPWAVAREQTASTTDSRGHVLLENARPDSLDGLFVVSPRLGHQRLPLYRSAKGDLQTKTTPTRPIDGQIKSPQDVAIAGIGSVKMFILTNPSPKPAFGQFPLRCSWSIAPITPDGGFHVEHIGLGALRYTISCPASFPFRQPYSSETTSVEAGDAPRTWQIEFLKQVKIRAKVIDADSGDPLPNIHISTWDGRLEPTFTNRKGEAEFFRTFDSVSYFPTDGLGEFFSTSAFYHDSKKVPTDGQIELEPITMVRSSSWHGQVVDQQGHAVAGATVHYEYSLERFNSSRMTYSDSAGNFRVRGVADRTALKLRAVKDLAASDTVTLVLPPEEDLVLKLIPQSSAKPTGRVITLAGKPVAGVVVGIARGVVQQKEKSDREDLQAVDLYAWGVNARTDKEGRFEFPATIDFSERLQIRIRDPGYFPFSSAFIDGAKLADSHDRSQARLLELGDFHVMRRCPPRQLTLLAVLSHGEPIAGAEVVVVGARTGTARGTTDARGQLQLETHQGQAIIAIHAQGYPVYFGELPDQAAPLRFVLPTSRASRSATAAQSIWNVDQKEFTAAAESLFAPVKPPDLKASTDYQRRNYLTGLASLHPNKYMLYLLLHLPLNPQLGPAALGSVDKALRRKPELIELAMQSPSIPALYRRGLLVTAAQATDNSDLRDEWLGEALVAARRVMGRERYYSMSYMARAFLVSGREKLARQVMDELWASATDLQAILKSGDRQELIGVARTVGPMLAIVNLQQANRLIALTGREVEIARLQTEARLVRGQANPEEFVACLRAGSLGSINSSGVGSWLYANSRLSGLMQEGLPLPAEFSQLIDDAKVRLRFLLFHARMTTDRTLRHDLLQLVIEAVHQCEPGVIDDYFGSHYVGLLLPELRQFKEIERDDLDRLIFCTLWNLPGQFETARLHTVLGGAAQIVALGDRRLARALLEPCVQDRGWLFMGRRLDFSSNETLNAIPNIDPEWSVQAVHQLCKGELRNNPTDQLALRAGMISALTAARDRAHKNGE